MKPSSLRIPAIRVFSFEAGMSTFSCSARLALRIRTNMSAIGSVIDIAALLPARLHDARNLALERQFAEAEAAEFELSDVAARTPAELAAVVCAHLEPGR